MMDKQISIVQNLIDQLRLCGIEISSPRVKEMIKSAIQQAHHVGLDEGYIIGKEVILDKIDKMRTEELNDIKYQERVTENIKPTMRSNRMIPIRVLEPIKKEWE